MTLPPWLAALVTPELVSVWRCGSCCRIYRPYGRGTTGPCDTCPGTVIQWKRCATCRRWLDASHYYLLKRRWLNHDCKRCHSGYRSKAWSQRYADNPVWAASVRAARRARHAAGKRAPACQ